jgi:hypothetical protein
MGVQDVPSIPGFSWLSRYERWLRGSRTFVRWDEGWASIVTIGLPTAGGWALTHVVVEFLGIGELGLLVWLAVWALLAPPLYLAATAPLRILAGRVDLRSVVSDPARPRSE